eukprot:14592371-Ditylum_brightwellii.AAC.1
MVKEGIAMEGYKSYYKVRYFDGVPHGSALLHKFLEIFSRDEIWEYSAMQNIDMTSKMEPEAAGSHPDMNI